MIMTPENNRQQYLRKQAAKHPAMQPQDVYKLIFQATFGAEHLLQDVDAAYEYFQKEYQDVVPGEEPLWEQIGDTVFRVNLGTWKQYGLPKDWLFRMFVKSVEKDSTCGQEEFWEYVEEAEALVNASVFSFCYADFQKYSEEYGMEPPRAVHHSEKYREAEHPSYRLVSSEYIRLIPILQKMAMHQRENKRKMVVAIDGRCASGKSTISAMLSEITGASVMHMDDFYLPRELRTEERLGQPGGNVHFERFREEVLRPLDRGESFSYRRFDCSRMELGEEREVPKSMFYVVEGAYSCLPVLGDYADLKVFSHIAPEEQLRRIGLRDGQKVLSMFRERWIPMEEKYFAFYSIKERADIIV